MKTIKEPNIIFAGSKAWWIGKTAACTNCGVVVQLETSDKVKINNPSAPNSYKIRVTFDCPTLGCFTQLSVSENRSAFD